MCYPVTCNSCAKTTWDGCGNHIDAVKAQVPANQWCTCERTPQPKPQAKTSILAGLFKR